MSTMESLQSKLQQLHGYIRRLGELTSQTTTQNATLITKPGPINEIDSIDEISTNGHHHTLSDITNNNTSNNDIDTIQQWLNQIKQQNTTQLNSNALIAQIAQTIRSSTTHAKHNNKTNNVKAKVAAYSTLQPSKPYKSLVKPTLIQPHTIQQSSVPIKEYSPANTAFVNGMWVSTNSDKSNDSTDYSVDDLDSIDDFDSTAVPPPKHTSIMQALSTPTHNKTRPMHKTTDSYTLNKQLALSSASTPSSRKQLISSHDEFEAELESKVQSNIQLLSTDTSKGQFTVPVDTKFINGKWQSTNEQSNELDDIDDFESNDNYDGNHNALQRQLSTHNSMSPTSRASIRSDLADFSDDEEIDSHIAAKQLPTMTLIRADQYIAPKKTQSNNQSIESTELDQLSDFDDDIEQHDSDADVRDDLGTFIDDSDNDTDSLSIDDAQHTLKQQTGSAHIIDKAKIELNEFALSHELIQQWQNDAKQYVQFIQPLLNADIQPVDPLQLILGDQYKPYSSKTTHVQEQKQSEYVDDIDDL